MKEFMIRGQFINEDSQRLMSAIYDHFDSSAKAITFHLSERRTLSANGQVWVWAKQISSHTGEDVQNVFARMKKNQGLPILLSDPEHGPVADFILKETNFWKRREDKQLRIIDAMEVTRKFSTRQHNEFRDNVQAFYNGEGFNLQYLDKEK